MGKNKDKNNSSSNVKPGGNMQNADTAYTPETTGKNQNASNKKNQGAQNTK